jgi:diadenylate cyclase
MLKRFQDGELLNLIRLIQPGTALREGLENVRRAKTGALIVIGQSEEMDRIIHGGFHMDTEFSPYALYELAKMDGAVILSSDYKRILHANVELNPNSYIPTLETGIRHRTAERVAKQTDCVVVSVSQRRDMITIYQGARKYILKDVVSLLASANQGMQTLDKYYSRLQEELDDLAVLEIEGLVTVSDVCRVIQRFEMVFRMAAEIEGTVVELGTEGRLISMQMEERLVNLYKDINNVFLDYLEGGIESKVDVLNQLVALDTEGLLETERVATVLNFRSGSTTLSSGLEAKGYRLLSCIPRLPLSVIKKLILHFDCFQNILNASLEQLEEVDGIGHVRAQAIVTGLKRIVEKTLG